MELIYNKSCLQEQCDEMSQLRRMLSARNVNTPSPFTAIILGDMLRRSLRTEEIRVYGHGVIFKIILHNNKKRLKWGRRDSWSQFKLHELALQT